MTKMRGRRDGVLVEFTHEDFGADKDGSYRSRFVGLEGGTQEFCVPGGSDSESRLHREIGWLMLQGFEPSSLQFCVGEVWTDTFPLAVPPLTDSMLLAGMRAFYSTGALPGFGHSPEDTVWTIYGAMMDARGK